MVTVQAVHTTSVEGMMSTSNISGLFPGLGYFSSQVEQQRVASEKEEKKENFPSHDALVDFVPPSMPPRRLGLPGFDEIEGDPLLQRAEENYLETGGEDERVFFDVVENRYFFRSDTGYWCYISKDAAIEFFQERVEKWGEGYLSMDATKKGESDTHTNKLLNWIEGITRFEERLCLTEIYQRNSSDFDSERKEGVNNPRYTDMNNSERGRRINEEALRLERQAPHQARQLQPYIPPAYVRDSYESNSSSSFITTESVALVSTPTTTESIEGVSTPTVPESVEVALPSAENSSSISLTVSQISASVALPQQEVVLRSTFERVSSYLFELPLRRESFGDWIKTIAIYVAKGINVLTLGLPTLSLWLVCKIYDFINRF